MEYQLYENSDILLVENSPNSKGSWYVASDNSMDNSDEYFEWSTLKIDEDGPMTEGHTMPNGTQVSRKRKLALVATSATGNDDGNYQAKIRATNNPYKMSTMAKDPLELDDKPVAEMKKSSEQKGSAGGGRMPHWQVEDYGDLNGDIDSSLSLGSDLANNPYGVSESILSINGMTVFKQELPSPTSNDMTNLQVRQVRQQSPTSTQPGVNNATTLEESNQMFNNTINQLLSQTGLALQNVVDNNLSSPNSTDNYNVTSTNYNYVEDCRFQYVLAAATSIATKQNEDTLTYLNQGQSYEIKLKKLGDLSMYRGKLLKSVVRICFHERRLQYMEKEQMALWQRARPGDRILEADIPLSYGAIDIAQPSQALNVISFTWDPTKEVGVYIKVNCISTEFTPKKHGGEKGVPFRIQVETYQNNDNLEATKRLHAAACQIKVFKLKGADRKHKQDREKILKRPLSEQEKYQPSYECTVMNDIPSDAVLSTPLSPMTACNSPEQNNQISNGPAAPMVQNLQTISPPISNGGHPVPKTAVVNTTPTTTISCAPTIKKPTKNLLMPNATPQQTIQWLTDNRFAKYLQTFINFSGVDMLRLTRDDLIDICGNIDGIRLFNALNLELSAPTLKIYVRRDNTSVFKVIYLYSHNKDELLQKLATLIGLSEEQVKDVYMEEGASVSQPIHVQVCDDMLRHMKKDSMFTLDVMQENEGFVLLLKPILN